MEQGWQDTTGGDRKESKQQSSRISELKWYVHMEPFQISHFVTVETQMGKLLARPVRMKCVLDDLAKLISV